MRNNGFWIFLLIFMIAIGIAFSQSYILCIKNLESSRALLEKNKTFRDLFNNFDSFLTASFSTIAMEKGIEPEKFRLLLSDDIVVIGEKEKKFNLQQFLTNPAEYIFEIIDTLSKTGQRFSLILRTQNSEDAIVQQKILSKLFKDLYISVKLDKFLVMNNKSALSNTNELIQQVSSILSKLNDNIFAYGELKLKNELATFYGKIVNDMVVLKVEHRDTGKDHYFSELLDLPVIFGYSVAIDPRDKGTIQRELNRFNMGRDILNLIENFSDLIGRVLISVDIDDQSKDKKIVLFLKGDGREVMKRVDQGIPGLLVKNDHGVKLYSYLGEWDIAFGNWYMIIAKNVDPVSVAIRVETGNRYDSNHVYYTFRKFGVETPFLEKIVDLNCIFGDFLDPDVDHTLFYQKGTYSNKLVDILFIK